MSVRNLSKGSLQVSTQGRVAFEQAPTQHEHCGHSGLPAGFIQGVDAPTCRCLKDVTSCIIGNYFYQASGICLGLR